MKINWNKKYTTYAIYAAGISAVVIFFAFVGVYIRSVWGGVLWLIDVISPLLYGCVIAYILSPVLNFFEKKIFRKIRHGVVRRGISVFSTYFIFLTVFGLLIYMVVPQLAHSFTDLQSNLALYTRSLKDWLESVSQRSEFFASIVRKIMETVDLSTFESPLTGLIEALYDLVQNSAPIIMGFFTSLAVQLKNIVVGLVFSGYILCSKELLFAQTNKLLNVFLNKKQIARLKSAVAYTDKTFGKYIIGTLTDALIVGVLTAIALLIFRMPYVSLISVLVACTNIIPIFGPFIGGIPSFIFIFIADPIKAIWFVLIILAIQQIDGNFIAPRILGNSTGLPAMFVIIAITVMGGLFGVVGMVIAVPVFAIAGKIITVATEKKEKSKQARNSGAEDAQSDEYDEEKTDISESNHASEDVGENITFSDKKLPDEDDDFAGSDICDPFNRPDTTLTVSVEDVSAEAVVCAFSDENAQESDSGSEIMTGKSMPSPKQEVLPDSVSGEKVIRHPDSIAEPENKGKLKKHLKLKKEKREKSKDKPDSNFLGTGNDTDNPKPDSEIKNEDSSQEVGKN